MTTTFYLDEKKVARKAMVERFGKDEIDWRVREAKKEFRNDPYQDFTWWMGMRDGMLTIVIKDDDLY